MSYLFTSESVSNGHPDKVCDQISDTVLDHVLAHDRNSRVAVETVASGKQIHVLGEMRTESGISNENIAQIVRNTIERIGYTPEYYGADVNDPNDVLLNVSISKQSPDIAQGVEQSMETRGPSNLNEDPYDQLGAGDQGIMFGHATRELKLINPANDSCMPSAIQIAHEIAREYKDVRWTMLDHVFGPDAKTQVTVQYDDLHNPVAVDTVLVSAQHADGVSQEEIREHIVGSIITPVLESVGLDFSNTRYLINPSGRFVIGGPVGDAGLTGRKIVVDTYGGYAPHGGGAFSGKDPSKVDRSAAYAARWVAKNLVANGFADDVTLQLSYAIGSAHPVSVRVDAGNEELNTKLEQVVLSRFDLRPAAIIERLGLDTFTQYRNVAAFGHFGRTDLDLPWEQVIDLL